MRDQILIIDDMQINRVILDEILQSDYDTVEAASGAEALNYLAQAEILPHAILLDIIMPGMDGFEVLRAIKSDARTEKIPVLFITAADSDTNESRGLMAGAADYISKPFVADVVKARIDNHVQLYHYREDLEKMVEKKTDDLIKTHEQLLETMATIIEYRSLESGMHIRRTSELTKLLVTQLLTKPKFSAELSALNPTFIIKAAVMHDIGKVAIPDNVLLKPGRLTYEEFELMKTHASVGRSIIDSISTELTESTIYLTRCREICYSHHERWDGGGYPDGLSGENIPLSARILAVIDVYEALVSERCYKKAMPHEEAVKIIRENAGTQFDPDIVETFLEIQEEFHNLINHIKS